MDLLPLGPERYLGEPSIWCNRTIAFVEDMEGHWWRRLCHAQRLGYGQDQGDCHQQQMQNKADPAAPFSRSDRAQAMKGANAERRGEYHRQGHYLPQRPGLRQEPASRYESDDDAERSPPQEPDRGPGRALTFANDR
jgi:hypothetical protein